GRPTQPRAGSTLDVGKGARSSSAETRGFASETLARWRRRARRRPAVPDLLRDPQREKRRSFGCDRATALRLLAAELERLQPGGGGPRLRSEPALHRQLGALGI